MEKKICSILFCIILIGALFQHPSVSSNFVQGKSTNDLSPPEIRALTAEQVRTFDCSIRTDISLLDCEGLVSFYESTNGAGWKNTFNNINRWLTSNPVSTWYGIYDVVDMHVGRIYLPDNLLTGTIPDDIDNLGYLKRLELNWNAITGSIPSSLGNIASLEVLEINGNQLSGSIPEQLGNLSNLLSLNLYDNDLTGSIPSTLGSLSKLQQLYLQRNDLTGSIPSTLGNLAELRYFFANNNRLEGQIPTQLGSLAKLMTLDLSNNQLTGSIPVELGISGHWLSRLDLSNNLLTGTIPAQFEFLGNLKYLYLRNNQLTGAIPPDLGADDIREINLSSNQLSGTIPGTIFADGYLTSLDLHSNKLSGDVPSSFNDSSFWPYDLLDLGYNLLNVPATDPSVAAWLTTYDPDWYLTQGKMQAIPDGGGTLTSNDGNTSVQVQSDSFEGWLNLTFAPQPEPAYDTGLLRFAGNSFELTAFDFWDEPVTTFAAPLIITIHYADADLGSIPEGSLSLYYWDTDSNDWADVVYTCPAGEYTRDLAANWLSVPVCHLSEFALMGMEVTLDNYIFLPLILR